MKKLYVIMILCLITVLGSSAQQTNNDAFLPIEVKYGEGVNTYSLQSNPRKFMIPGFIENENAANYVFSPSITTTTPLQDPYLLTLKIASIKESSLFTAFKDGSEPVYSLNIGGTSFSGTGSDMGNGLFCIIFFASKKDFGKLTETLANERNITASISKNASNLKIHIGGPNQNDTQLAKAFASVLLLMQSQLNEYIKNDRSQPSNSVSSSSSSPITQSVPVESKSGIDVLKDHVFGFVSTPPSQCTLSSVNNEVYRKYGFKLDASSSTMLYWSELEKPVGFDYVLNGKRIGTSSFYQNDNYRSWDYSISELKTSTSFNASLNYTKQLQRELEAEGYEFEIKSSNKETYEVESRNKDIDIQLRCCSTSKSAVHDAWGVHISFNTKY